VDERPKGFFMQIHEISPEKLIPYSGNPRKNNGAVSRMMASIKEFGFKVPILARHRGDEIEVCDGHLRLKASKKLKLTTVPVIFCDEWTEAQVRAFRLLVNRSVNWATWDDDLLTLELGELDALDFDLSLTGFDPFEIDQFLFPPDAVKPSAEHVPKLPKTAVTRLGDLWRCDLSRILCGDATSPEAVATLFGPGKPKLLVTDPPYGVKYQPDWREKAGLGKQRQTGVVQNDDRVDWIDAFRLASTCDIAYVWHAGVHAGAVAAALETCGLRIRAQIIWRKQHFALSRGDYSWQHEPCWYAVRAGKSARWSGDRKQTTVWDVPNLNPFGGSQETATGHGTQKPVELMRRPMLNNSRPGDGVYDAFIGSGVALVAATLTDRVCYGMDIDPGYVDVTVTRWQELTGKKAILDGDGRTFEQVAEERKPTREVEECPAQN
jgi:DNA modification methylase